MDIKTAIKKIISFIVCAAYLFIPPLFFIKILNPDNLISSMDNVCPIILLLISVTTILSYILIGFTTNNLTRFIVIILSALGSFITVITLTPNNPCVVSFVFMFFLAPLCFVYFICFVISLKKQINRSH